MKLKLLRTKLFPTHTIGQLYINDDYFCFTLEDVVRELEGVPVEKWKIKGETAIPRGSYRAYLETSPRFGPETPTIGKVPGFTGIRFHAGNTAADTEGCIILGYQLTDTNIIKPGTTRTAVNDFKAILRRVNGEEITIDIL